MSELPPSARKVQDAAGTLGLDIVVREMTEPTRTAQEAASACGVTAGQIVKSLVFSGATSGKPCTPACPLLAGTKPRQKKRAAPAPRAKSPPPPAPEAVRALTGFAIGG